MDNKNLNKVEDWYKSFAGDFSFRTLASLSFTILAVGIAPFVTPDASFNIITWGWALFTTVKVFFNLFIKYTLANHTIDKKMRTDEELLETHSSIKDSRKIIDQNKYNKFLPKATREENIKNKLDALYDKINLKLNNSKEDDEILELTNKLETIESYQEAIENNKDIKIFRKDLAKDLASIKIEVLTPNSLFSKNDTTTKAKKVGMDLNKAVSKLMQNSLLISIGLIVLLNFLALSLNSWSKDAFIQMVINIVILFWSGALGIDGAVKIITQYKDVALYKDTFLKSFIVRAEHYAKPTEEELDQNRKDELKEAERDRFANLEKEKQEKLEEIERIKRNQEFELEKMRINAEIEKAKAEIEANKFVNTPVQQPNQNNKTIIELKVKEDKEG